MISGTIITLSVYSIVLLLSVIYFYYKTKYALQEFQQSAYSNDRFIKHICEKFNFVFGLNELLLLVVIIIFEYFLKIHPALTDKMTFMFLEQLILAVIVYYNLKFFQLSKKRYTEKIPLNITKRVKRQIITLIILIIIIVKIFWNLPFFVLDNVLVILYIITYTIYILLLIVSLINNPIEKLVQKKYKKMAMKELQKHSDLCVIGITGSYGKTSIKNIINDMLKEYEITLISPKSFNTPMGLAITINNHLNNLHENFIAEMGAYYPGEIEELAKMVKPKIGIVSSIGPQHLETFKNIENIQKTKMELIENLPADGLGILNYDNEYIRDYKIKNNVQIKWYSLENPDVDVYAYDIEYLDAGMRFKFKINNISYSVTTSLLGKHNIYNILAAIIVLDYKKIPMEKILQSINKITPIKNRLELKRINKNLTIIDDAFNGNIEGMVEGVNILSKYNNYKILITPGIIDGGIQNSELNSTFAQKIPENIDEIVIIGKYNHEALIQGIMSKNKEKITCFDNFLEGYQYAEQIVKDKTILIANDLPDKYDK